MSSIPLSSEPNGSPTIAYIGTYPPNACGIATFLLDLVSSTDLAGLRSVVVAVSDDPIEYDDPKVCISIDKENLDDYSRAAETIKRQGASLLCIQHEYGIYGGDHGRYILVLAEQCDVPIVVTLHTVLPDPTPTQREIIVRLSERATALVVMANKGVELLERYGVERSKIRMIPHGAPMVVGGAEKLAKEKFGLTGRKVISTFGLISPNKGIEDAIDALPEVVLKHPDVLYLVLGQTHPSIIKHHGEEYRESLEAQVERLGLWGHVQFVNRYLSLQDLLDYLLATDIYVTPYYANPNQITSGTLAYAMGAGKVIVSTPYTHAEELLADGRGFLYPFRYSPTLSGIISELLENPDMYQRTKALATEFGKTITWPRVGVDYLKLYGEAIVSDFDVDHRIERALTLVESQQI
jgi:polysaccharide biosynthesis protein PslF